MNRDVVRSAVLLIATATTGLTAGVFGDWAHTIVRGLGTTDDRTFVTAFQALDRAILNPWFLLPFVGALLSSGLAVLLHRHGDRRAVRRWAAVAFGLLLAAFVITMAVHEPLNAVVRNAPDLVDDPAAIRAALQETRWAAWHLVRTVATVAAFGALLGALIAHGRTTADHRAPLVGAAP